MNAIQTTGLTKIFDERLVLRNVRLEIAQADCVALTGANGAGKTTLLRCLCGVTRPTSGSICWYGNESRVATEVRRLIGYVGHEQQIYPYLTVRENLVFAARMSDVSQPRRQADAILESMGMQHVSDQLAVKTSRGTRQRLAIARATIHDPRIVLLDEPFTGLDPQGRDWLAAWISQLGQRGRTVCFATHQTEWIQRLARRVLHLRAGEIHELAPEMPACTPRAA
jgi:heme ABC exporter ATP-binding subunit CcmA